MNHPTEPEPNLMKALGSIMRNDFPKSPTQPPELTAERLEKLSSLWLKMEANKAAGFLPNADTAEFERLCVKYGSAILNSASQHHSLRSDLATAKDRIVELESAIRYIHQRNGHLGDWVDDGTYLKWLDDKCSELLSHSTITPQSEELERLRTAIRKYLEVTTTRPAGEIVGPFIPANRSWEEVQSAKADLMKALSHSTKAEGESHE